MSIVTRRSRCSLLALAIVCSGALSSVSRADDDPPKEPDPLPEEPTNEKPKEKIPEEAPVVTKHRMRSIPSAPPEEPSTRYVSLTWLPLQLLLPMVAVAAEVRFSDEVSASLFGGYGTVRVNVGDERTKRSAYQVGAQLHYYVSGAFDLGGVHVGAEAILVHVSDSSAQVSTTAIVPGVTVGPFVGFKLVTRSGFTFDSQVGIGLAVAHTSGAARADEDQQVSLLGNLAAGWTF